MKKQIEQKPEIVCPQCKSKNVEPAFGHKLNHCLSCWLAFDSIIEE